ncbi:hypothetical protein [Roseomonas chloroacetimidivorans]|uniref:hypothetical protein n=1 Tax=Roseomonas chloroacetimidivorans TaxID=1766656 RepID=UPI003C749421
MSKKRLLRADRPKEVLGKPIPMKDLKRRSPNTVFADTKRDNPELYAEWRAKAAATGRLSSGRTPGSRPGFPASVIAATRKTAQKKAEERFKKMADDGLIDTDDKIAKKAMLKLLEIISMNDSVPDAHPNKRPVSTSDEIKAASKLLEFTKAKPMTKSEVTVNSAEDFLKSLLAEEEDKKES